jgi:hypothetical protein
LRLALYFQNCEVLLEDDFEQATISETEISTRSVQLDQTDPAPSMVQEPQQAQNSSSSCAENDGEFTPEDAVSAESTSEASGSAYPTNSERRPRRLSIVASSYKEPSIRSKLRAGDQFTFSSGYDAGIKAMSMAERDKERAKRRSRQSLS